MPVRTWINTGSRQTFRVQWVRPDLAESMHDELKGYLESVDTKLPRPNPDYDPSRDGALLSVTSAN